MICFRNLARTKSFPLENEHKNHNEFNNRRSISLTSNSKNMEVNLSVTEETLQISKKSILQNARVKLCGNSLGRLSGLVNRNRLPFQHSLSFPGSNYDPPKFPVLTPNGRKWSISVPDLTQGGGTKGGIAKGAQSPLLSSNVSTLYSLSKCKLVLKAFLAMFA